MKYRKLDVEVTLILDSPFHVGGGKGAVSNHSFLQKNLEKEPYIPGSAIKGKVRQLAMQFMENSSTPCRFAHHKEDREQSCECLLCDMLGKAGNDKGRLYFSEFSIQSEGDVFTAVRTGNAVDCYTRTAKDAHLFGVEIAESGEQMRLVGTIHGYLDASCFEKQKKLLFTTLEYISFIGGNSGRGLGWIQEIKLEDKSPENVPLLPNLNEQSRFQKVRVKLKPQSPLLIGKHTTQSNYRETQFLIPGSVVRASLARELVGRCSIPSTGGRVNYVRSLGENRKDEQFYDLCENFSDIRISAFMPKGASVFPLTAVERKNREDAEIVAWDTLAQKISGKSEKQSRAYRVERKDGFYCDEEREIVGVKPETSIISKNAIDRYRGTSQDEMLYSLRVLTNRVKETRRKKKNKGAEDDCLDGKKDNEIYFEGEIEGVFRLDELKNILGDEIRVGAYQTSGFGKCSVECIPESEVSAEGTMKDADKAEMRKRIEDFNTLIETESVTYIPITLHSDTFAELQMRDNPSDMDNDAYLAMYQELLFSEIKEAALHMAIVQTCPWRGFDTSQTTDYLLDARIMLRSGGVFVLKTENLTDSLLDALWALQRTGLCKGARAELDNNNGYGKVVVADSFHIKYLKKQEG